MKVNVNGYTVSFPNLAEFLLIYVDLFVLHTYKVTVSKKEPARIIDCGAHIGVAALYYKKLYPQAHVTCFEPSPTSLAFLKKNISQNQLSDIEIVPAAVWDTDGTITFSHSPWSWGDHVHTEESNNTFAVKSTRLGKYLQKPVDILKMDIEGAEETVMKDIEPYLDNVDSIVMEYHHIFKPLPNSLDSILDILEKHHFKIKWGPVGKTLTVLKRYIPIPFPFYVVFHAQRVN